jgi:hypothetical protein
MKRLVEQLLLTAGFGLVSALLRKRVAASLVGCFAGSGSSGGQTDGLMKTVESGFIAELLYNKTRRYFHVPRYIGILRCQKVSLLFTRVRIRIRIVLEAGSGSSSTEKLDQDPN